MINRRKDQNAVLIVSCLMGIGFLTICGVNIFAAAAPEPQVLPQKTYQLYSASGLAFIHKHVKLKSVSQNNGVAYLERENGMEIITAGSWLLIEELPPEPPIRP